MTATGKAAPAKSGHIPFGSDNEWNVNYARCVVDIICEACGSPFRPLARFAAVQRFCSRACASRRNGARTNALYPQAGPGNFNFKNWASRNASEYARRFTVRHPEKYRAQCVLQAAVRRGKLTRPTSCSACGIECRPHGHHEDYTQPLKVEWVCRDCHRKKDRARREREAATHAA